ncbi:hypothetical protein Tco_0237239 [Tanacetum coccineum]
MTSLPLPKLEEAFIVLTIYRYESDSEDEHVSQPTEEHETPSFANQQVKTPRETDKNQFTHSKNPKVDKKGLGYGFATKECLHQFVPTAVLTRTSKIPVSTARTSGTNTVNTARASGTNNVSTARHNFNSQAILTKAARKISTVKPFVIEIITQNFLEQGIVPIVGCSMPHTPGLETKEPCLNFKTSNGGPVTFGGSKGYITGKGKIKIGKLDFVDVLFWFHEFKLPDANQSYFESPGQIIMYGYQFRGTIVPSGGLAWFDWAKATN